jgi:hypothetical protein
MRVMSRDPIHACFKLSVTLSTLRRKAGNGKALETTTVHAIVLLVLTTVNAIQRYWVGGGTTEECNEQPYQISFLDDRSRLSFCGCRYCWAFLVLPTYP